MCKKEDNQSDYEKHVGSKAILFFPYVYILHCQILVHCKNHFYLKKKKMLVPLAIQNSVNSNRVIQV